MSPMFYTVNQVCDLLQISRSTVKRRLADGPAHGGFTRVKIGGSIRIPCNEVDSLIPRKRRHAA